MDYESHIRALCRAHGIAHATNLRHVGESCAWPTLRKISTPPVTDEHCYFAALHEIGHVVMGHVSTRMCLDGWDARVLQEEGEAWHWAFDNALHEPSPEMAHHVLRYLGQYWRHRYAPAIKTTRGAYRTAKRRMRDIAFAV